MKGEMKIMVLAENTAVGQGIRGEHGLSFWLERDGLRLLFDTGQGLVLSDNAAALNLDLATLDALVLSHGHYDHTGGLAQIMEHAVRPLSVYAHPGALNPKYRVASSGVREIGMPAPCRMALEDKGVRLVLSAEPAIVAPGIRTTGEITRFHDEERSEEYFRLDEEGRQEDPIADDQALILETGRGVVVLLGCAHAGLINTLDRVREVTEGAPLLAVAGGMHLRSATPERLAWTVGELRRFDIATLVPMHCTGFVASATLWQAFPGRCRVAGAGSVLAF